MKKSNDSTVLGVLAVLITVAVFLVSWKLIIPGYAANKSSIAKLDQDIAAAQAKKDALDQSKADLSSIDSAFKALTVAVPADEDAPNLISELEAIALKNNIVLPAISISNGESATAAASDSSAAAIPGSPVSVAVSVTGTFDQLNGFVTSLEKSVKFLNIQSMTYSVAEKGQLGLALNLQTYSRIVSSNTTTQ